ncbi:NAD-dependent epimerase/dehydratase family protein [bacterium]|nr:NAD-dependent epimerase/dehydratase family protein [bacterium]
MSRTGSRVRDRREPRNLSCGDSVSHGSARPHPSRPDDPGALPMTRFTSRRDFMKTASLATAAVGAASLTGPLLGSALAQPGFRGLRVLVLGGTGQTGPHLVRELMARGHTVTLFNRGNRSAELFPDVECIVGDRALDEPGGLDALKAEVEGGRTWDVGIDIWPHIPKIVENTGVLLQDAVDHFMFVSSLSAYASHAIVGADETAPLGSAPDADETEFSGELFGPFKAECENRVRRLYPTNHTIFRPCLIIGPRDFSFRGVHWPVRVRRGGEVLAPGDGSTPVQVIDGRDLAAFEALCMEKRPVGAFNVAGPHPQNPLTMGRLLRTCRGVSGSDARFVWADAEFLTGQEVGAWMDMPCWVPTEGEYAGFGSNSNARAVAAGLAFRPLSTTLRDTLAWYDGLDAERRESISQRAGLSAAREQEVLAAWRAARG